MTRPFRVVAARHEAVARSLGVGAACRVDPDPDGGPVPDGCEAVRCVPHAARWVRPVEPPGRPLFLPVLP